MTRDAMEFRRITDRRTSVVRQTKYSLSNWQTSNRPPALRWAAWTERLLRRHAPGSAPWYALDAVLRQNAAVPRETFVDRRASLSFGLYLTIPSVRTMLAPLVTTIVQRTTTVGERGLLPMRIVRASATERVIRLTERARIEQHYHDDTSVLAVLRQTDQRLLHTHTLAAVERIYARQGQRFEPWGSAPPVAAQVVKQPEASPTEKAKQANPFASEAAFTPLRHWNDVTAPAAPPDITRLTDQVIQSIDERLIASRERFGRR